MKTLHAEAIDKLSRSDADVLILDVLPAEDYAKQHIPSALNNPVDAADFVERTRSLVDGLDQPVVVYCANRECPLSERAAEQLEAAGFEHVIDMEGGIAEWKQAGLPVEP